MRSIGFVIQSKIIYDFFYDLYNKYFQFLNHLAKTLVSQIHKNKMELTPNNLTTLRATQGQ